MCGAAIARRFATAGATVAFTYSGSQAAAAALAKELGAEAIKADSADRDAVIDVVRSRGALDVLVVNSGVILFGDARTLDPDAVDHLIDVNVRAPYHAYWWCSACGHHVDSGTSPSPRCFATRRKL